MVSLSFRSMGDEDWLRTADVIRRGGLVCLPTDTVYGLACDPASGDAKERLFEAKGRERDKPISLMYADAGQLRQALPSVGDDLWRKAELLLLEPVTVILPFHGEPGAPGHGRAEGGSVGARIVPGRYRDAYARLPLPLALTSANLSGQAEPRKLDQVPGDIEAACELVIDDGPCQYGRPTTVVDLRPLASGEAPRLLREGVIDRAALQRMIGDIR